MSLPPPLRQAIERALEGVPLSDLSRAAEGLSQRYRAEVQDGRYHLADDLAARAYLATRLPATYGAVHGAMRATAARQPDFAPRTLLDVGAGPGTVLWAALELWPSLNHALLLEGSPHIRAWGERLTEGLGLERLEWRTGDALKDLPTDASFDLVTLSYVLDELTPATRAGLVARLWTLAADTLLIIEPGTPAGWKRILEARQQLIEADAHLLAPCPHSSMCPLAIPDWCHFSERVERSRLHRQAKGAELGWEDEKYIYIAASKQPGRVPEARVLAPPRSRSGLVNLKLCRNDGQAEERTVSKREGVAYKEVRKLEWGDVVGDKKRR